VLTYLVYQQIVLQSQEEALHYNDSPTKYNTRQQRPLVEAEVIQEDDELIEGHISDEASSSSNSDGSEEDPEITTTKEFMLEHSKDYQHICDAIAKWRTLNQHLSVKKEHEDPRINRIKEYIIKGLNAKEICQLEEISERTLSRLKKEHGIYNYSKDIPDQLVLDAMVDILATQSTSLGWIMMQGYLKGMLTC
jgi:hypothetical protein